MTVKLFVYNELVPTHLSMRLLFKKTLYPIDIVCDIVELLASFDDEYDTSAAFILPLWKEPSLSALSARVKPSHHFNASLLLPKREIESSRATRSRIIIISRLRAVADLFAFKLLIRHF